jgi:DnaJ-class molecular chaperone
VAVGEGLTDPPDHYRVLEVHPEASREVIEAAFTVLREKLIRDDGPDAGRELARLNAAHRTLSDSDLRTAYDSLRA